MRKYDYLIVGAGLYGAVFAREMTDRGKRCLVVERRGHVAGNAYTEDVAGVRVHRYGAHIFHTNDEEVWAYVNRFARFNDYVHSPMADFHGERYHLPFNLNTFRELWGVTDGEQARSIIERQRDAAGIREIRNLEEQAISLVGTDVYEKLIRGYTRKQWGRPCDRLPASVIRRIPVRFTADNRYFDARHQGIPIGGYTAMVGRLLEGSDVRTGVDYLACRDELDALAERVVFTGPIDAYYGYCLGALEYRTLRFETEILDVRDHQGCSVVNYTDEETPWTRIVEHRHFEETDAPRTVITREYSAEWKKGDEPYYPVGDEKNSALYARYRELADREERVIFGGRLGEYKYYDMDVVIAAARTRAREE